jgi:hypothetical protein
MPGSLSPVTVVGGGDGFDTSSAEATEIVVAATNAAKIIERMAFLPKTRPVLFVLICRAYHKLVIAKAGAGARSSGVTGSHSLPNAGERPVPRAMR